MTEKRRQAPLPERPADEATASVLPMEVLVGDRLTDEQGEWEVVAHPVALEVTWWAHKIRTLHRNDFIMAMKTDALVAEI